MELLNMIKQLKENIEYFQEMRMQYIQLFLKKELLHYYEMILHFEEKEKKAIGDLEFLEMNLSLA